MSNYPEFIGPSYTLDTIQYDCQNCINLYPEPDETKAGTDGNIAQLVRTPGLTLAVQLVSGAVPVRGAWQSTTGEVYFACGNGVYQITETNGTFTSNQIGTLQTATGFVNFADNAGLLWIVDGPNGYVWQNSTFTQINDPSWQGADYVVVLADQFIFNVPGTNQFYWSDINSPTFTLAGGYGVDAKQGNSDPIISMQVYGLFLWLVGSQTTEIWTTNPGATTSYQRIPGPYLQTGCLAGQTFQYTEYGGIWLSQNPRGGAQVVMTPAQGYTVSRISTFAVEQALQEYSQSDIEASTAFFYQQKGHIFYQLNPGNGKSSWVYDITTSLQLGVPTWHERTYTNQFNQQSRHLADNHAVLNGYNLVGDYSQGNVYYLDPDNYTDNGQFITRTRTAPHVAQGFNRIFYNAFTLLCRTGVGLACSYTNPTPPPEWSLEFTDSGTGNANGGSYQSIVSDDAGVYAMATGGPKTVSTSNGGTTWTANATFPGAEGYPGQIFFNGTYFVALDIYTTYIYFSTDLQTWTTNSVAYEVYQIYQDSEDGAVYFAPYATSSTDVNLYRIAPNSNTITQVITAGVGPNLGTYGNGILTAGGITVSSFNQYPTTEAWYSTDGGITWNLSASDLSGIDLFGLTYNGTTWLFVGQQYNSPYNTVCFTSTDGMTWTQVYSGSYSNPPYDNECTAFNGLFLSFQGTTIASSPDAITWTPTTISGIEDIGGITVTSSKAYAYGGGGIYESTDGLTWTASNVTNSTQDVEAAGLILAASSTGGGSPVFIYKRTA